MLKEFNKCVYNFLDDDKICVVPQSYDSIGKKAFENMKNLEAIILPDELLNIQDSAFKKCTSLRSIKIPMYVRRIPMTCFKECYNLTDVELPDKLEIIDRAAFSDCKSLQKIILPKYLNVIASSAFDNCKSLKEINIPNDVETIGFNAFRNCKSLEQIDIPESILRINSSCFMNCANLKNINLKEGLSSIQNQAFYGCNSLEYVKLPSTVVLLADKAFYNCKNLKQIELSESLDKIGDYCFSSCNTLTNVNLPMFLKTIGSYSFNKCKSLEVLNIPNTVKKIGYGAFKDCEKLKQITIPKNIKEIKNFTFLNCKNLEEIDVSNVTKIGRSVFEGCKKLKKLEISSSLKEVGEDVLNGCNFKYIYKIKGNKNLFFSKTLPSDVVLEKTVDINKTMERLSNSIIGFDMSLLMIEKNIDKYTKIVEKLEKSKTKLPLLFINELDKNNLIDEFLDKSNFAFFKNEIKDLDLPTNSEDLNSLYKFAKVMGCFSNELMTDKDGRETSVKLGQKASSFVAGIYSKGSSIDKRRFFIKISDIDINEKPSIDFMKFISKRGPDKSYENFTMLLNLEREYHGILLKTVKNFDTVKKMRVAVSSEGKTVKLSWKDACIKNYNLNYYSGITKDNSALANVFREKGMEQKDFNLANNLYKYQKQKNIPNHILGYELKEKTIPDEIEEIKSKTGLSILKSKELIDNLYKKQFTFEMLDKSAPENAIIGLYCDCCAIINSEFYGKEIATDTIISEDLQNMVVRDTKGEIIAKCAMYVNKEYGYIVINEFEMNDDYKDHEIDDGFYDNKKSLEDAQKREQIFKTFMRGIKSFVEAYDAKNPNNPIKQVNVGMGYNRLKEQCLRYKEQTGQCLSVGKYAFVDAKNTQRVLYKRDEKLDGENEIKPKTKQEEKEY